MLEIRVRGCSMRPLAWLLNCNEKATLPRIIFHFSFISLSSLVHLHVSSLVDLYLGVFLISVAGQN